MNDVGSGVNAGTGGDVEGLLISSVPFNFLCSSGIFRNGEDVELTTARH